MAGGNDRIPVFPWPSMISSELVGPNDGGGINASQADPTGGVSNILQAGPSTGTPVPPDRAASTAAAPAAQPQVILREQNHRLPMSNVIRIMRSVLPMDAKTSDDAKDTIQECASEFISFITSEANERCKREHRMAVTAEDVIWAMSRLGFEHYVDPLSCYLQRYRENQGDLRSGLYGEYFPIIKHRHRPPITDAPNTLVDATAAPAAATATFIKPRRATICATPSTISLNKALKQANFAGCMGAAMVLGQATIIYGHTR